MKNCNVKKIDNTVNIKEAHGGNVYIYGKDFLDFSANLNPLGLASEIKNTIIENIDSYDIYPDIEAREVRAELGKFYSAYNLGAENFLMGNGAGDLIYRIFLGLRPKKTLIVAPTFSEYEEAAGLVGSAIEYFRLTEEENFRPSDKILDSIHRDIDLVFICNPNNPTGITVKKDLMIKIAEKCRDENAVLVVDECFLELTEEEENSSLMGEIKHSDNVIILRAFTKTYAMAGLRLGYIVFGKADFGEKIRKAGQPWQVSTVAMKSGVEALRLESYLGKSQEYIRKERNFISDKLRSLGFKVFSSEANYVFFKGKPGLTEKLKEKKILIRNCSNYRFLDEGYYRVAVKTSSENKKLISALEKVLSSSNLKDDRAKSENLSEEEI